MSLSLSSSFVEQKNLVIPLAQSATKSGLAVRVASNGTGTLGTLTASGAQAPSVSWTLNQNPAWVTLSVDLTTMVATLNFSNAQAQANPYQFYVSVTDGLTTANFPIFLEVREPFSIVAASHATSFSVDSYDSTVADIEFQGVGLNGAVDTGVQFIPPTVLPGGLKFITSNGGSMLLRVPEPSAEVLSGGIDLFTSSPVSTQITLQAYKPGTIYDNPDRCCTQEFTIESLSAKKGVIDLGVTVFYNTTLNAFELDSFVDFLGGQAQTLTYEWGITGTATGNITSGGTSADTAMVWTPATPGNVGFSLKAKNSSGVVIGQAIIAPVLNSSGAGIPCSTSGTWNSTDAIKLSFSEDSVRDYAGNSPSITISTPSAELGGSETVTVTLAVSGGSALESTATLSTTTVTLTSGSPSATFTLLLPTSSLNQKWIVTATAANASSNPTRTGFAEVVFISNGGQPLTITSSAGTSLTSNVGQTIPPVTLIAKNSSAATITGATFSLLGAPDGLFINPNGQLTGNVLKPGTYTFSLVAEAAGYARSYSSTLTLTASEYSTPLEITDATPSVASLPDNQQFNVTWGYSGTPLTLNLAQGFNVRSVLGTTSTATTEVGSSVITIYGTSFYGDAYSVPALVLSSSVVALGKLPDAPTIGTLDENYNLALNWNPLTIDGNYQVYKAWNIWLKQLPNGTNQLQTISGQLPTGLEPTGATQDSRIFETVLSAGDWQVDMQALTNDSKVATNSAGWDLVHAFPTAINAASVTFDNQTVSLGQSVTITLDPNYIGADTWQAIYPDGTTSGWMPISVKSLAKTLSTPGNLPIVIQTQRDYSKNNPPVKLRREVTKTIFVMDQQYTSGSVSDELTGTLGIGGESGFEIIDASNNAVPLAPYEVVVRALVRDTISNELKLMVATSRTPNASSLLGTMAIDVFPIAGRPRVKDLIDPSLYLSAEAVKAGNPPKIATTTLPNIIVGKPMSDFPLQVAANSGVAPFSWYADNLPFGVKLSTDGTLSGTPIQLGAYTSDFVVMDSNEPPFIANATLALTVESDLKITTSSLPAAVVTVPYNTPVVSTGGIPPYTWSVVAGAPPRGVTIDPSTGTLVGTPVTYNSTTDFAKTFGFTVQVVDAIGAIASAALTMALQPAALQLGALDQNTVFAGGEFEITVPIFGGTAPYTLTTFADDGPIGTGLQVAAPATLAVVAGVEPQTLTITTSTQGFFPESYPFDPAFELAASGGTAPYRFSIVSGVNTTLPSAAISASMMTASLTTDGTYSVAVRCTDALGHVANQTIQVVSQQKNGGTYAIKPVSVNTNGSNNPTNWTVTPITALPDAKQNNPYNGGSNVYYGLALYENSTLHMTQRAGQSPMNFSIRSGSLPNDGANPPNSEILTFSGNSFGNATDYSGIELFNVSGGTNPTALGPNSFEAEFSNIVAADGSVTQVVARESITVTTAGGGSTTVVVLKTTENYTIDLTTAVSSPYPWYYPLTAEGGVGPYTFSLQNGTTLPGAVITTLNGLPALASSTGSLGAFVANLTATDKNGAVSAVTPVNITLTQTPVEPINILNWNLPTYLYANRAIPANTYFVESDLVANWSATGLPAGVSLTTAADTKTYLTGTPTATGNVTPVITATSVVYHTTTTKNIAFEVRAQAAAFINAPTSATVGTNYRAVNNNAIISVQYTGYQPGDSNLPLVTSQNGTIGAPGTLNSGTPTTAVSNLTADGFILSYDYTNNTFGTDVLTLGASIATLNLPVVYPTLVAVGKTTAASVSEYATSATLAPPVNISGGLAPYTISLTGFSDPRFTSQSGQAVVSVASLPIGQTSCMVSMLVTDSSGGSTTATGTLQVTIRQETFETINFSNINWAVNVSTGSPFTAFLVPNSTGSVPALGHAPYQYYVDSVTIPSALTGFVQISPSKRVLAIQCNANSASASVADVNQSLVNSGTFIVAAVNPSAAPASGSYQIPVTLRVVDANNLTSSQAVTVNLTIS